MIRTSSTAGVWVERVVSEVMEFSVSLSPSPRSSMAARLGARLLRTLVERGGRGGR